MSHNYFVYVVASRSHTLYCGVTNSMTGRIQQHQDGAFPGFCKIYICNRLVWLERYECIENAIDREKQISGRVRKKKIALIEKDNPTWVDLSELWRKPDGSLRSHFDPEE